MELMKAPVTASALDTDSLSATATREYSCLQPTLMCSRSSIATLSAGDHSANIQSLTHHEQHHSSSEACSPAHARWSQNQMSWGARVSYSAPLPWFSALSKHAMCGMGMQLSCSFEEGDDMPPGLASCCSDLLPACTTASHNNAHAACIRSIYQGDCGSQAHHHQQLASNSSATAGGNRQCTLCPIAKDHSLQGSSQRSSSKPLSPQHDSCAALWREKGRSQLAYNNMWGCGIPCSGRQQQQDYFVPCMSDPLTLIEEEIVQLLLMTQQLSAAAGAAAPGTAVASACAAALRMHDATLMRALETRDALEQAAIAAVAAAAAQEEEEEARRMLWHQTAACLRVDGAPLATAATVSYGPYGMIPPRQHVDAWLEDGDETAEDFMWQQQQPQQQQLYRQAQDVASSRQQQQQQQRQRQACISAPAPMRPGAHCEPTFERNMHQTAAAAASYKQPEADVQVLQLLPML